MSGIERVSSPEFQNFLEEREPTPEVEEEAPYSPTPSRESSTLKRAGTPLYLRVNEERIKKADE